MKNNNITWFHVYLPILFGDFFHLYHSFNCFIRFRLRPGAGLDWWPAYYTGQFVKGFIFTLLVGLAKYFFYKSAEMPDEMSGRYRTGIRFFFVQCVSKQHARTERHWQYSSPNQHYMRRLCVGKHFI